MLGLYIHIPFCKHLCHYCDFVKVIPKNEEVIHRYIDKLIEELKSYQDYYHKIDTIFIGGGTPNYLPDQELKRLLAELKKISPKEFTIEINPENYSENQGIMFKEFGVNRISIGAQTSNEKTLEFLNRKHQNKQVQDAVSSLKNLGINNISLDLIFAIPGQTINDIENDLHFFHNLDISHLSYYSLILEENTYFHYLYNRQKFEEVDDITARNMYEYIINQMTSLGYKHYEISNFSKDSYKSIHNQIYWTFNDYIGIGLGAHGLLNGERFYNETSFNRYLRNSLKDRVMLTHEDKITEELIMGLRLMKGVNIANLEQKYEINIDSKFPKIKEMIDLNLLTKENGYLKLTKEGIFFGNQVFQIFV